MGCRTGLLSTIPRALVLLLCTALVFIAYFPVLSGDFVWDDVSLILNDDFIHELHSPVEYLKRSFWTPTENNSAYFRPLTVITFSLDWKIWNGQPGGFHLTNILIHLTNIFILFMTMKKRKASFEASTFCALFFGLHPRLAESVSWISGRTDLLATMFVLLAIYIYPYSSNFQQIGSQREIDIFLKKLYFFLLNSLSALFILTGLLCKEVAFAGFAALLTIELQYLNRKNRSWKRGVLHLLPTLCAVFCYIVLRLSAANVSADTQRIDFRLWNLKKIGLILASIGEYMQMSIDFLRPGFQNGPSGAMHITSIITGLLFTILAVIFIIKVGWKNFIFFNQFPLIILGTSAIAMVSQIVALENLVLSADRYLYLPLAAFIIILASLLSKLSFFNLKLKIRNYLCIFFLVGGSFAVTHSQARSWQTERSLCTWGCLHKKNPLSCLLLGQIFQESGQPETALFLYENVRKIEDFRKKNTHWIIYSTVKDGSYILQTDAFMSLGLYEEMLPILSEQTIRKKIASEKIASVIAILKHHNEGLSTRHLIEDIKEEATYSKSAMAVLQKLNQISTEIDSLVKKSRWHQKQRPESLSDAELRAAFRLSDILEDTLSKTRISIELLRRNFLSIEEKNQLRIFIEEKGICSALSEKSQDYSYPKNRCTPLRPRPYS